MYRLKGAIRRYSWGSTALVHQLLGRPVDGRPIAEVWLGAHPDGPAVANGGGRKIPLDELVAAQPQAMLGPRVLASTGPRLPFLPKILAAAHALSIQVHPTTAQAVAGFAAEDERGVPRTDPARTYRDRSAKPEIVYALTPFELLSGLREPEQAAKLVAELEVPALNPLVVLLREQRADAHRGALTWLLGQRGSAAPWVEAVAATARDAVGARPELAVVHDLAQQFPGDPGLLAPLLLNHERLEPGQALYTAPGTLHAYLRGMAIEVMAASDNVLRAGLTTKHVDVTELLSITDFTPRLTGFLRPARGVPGIVDYVAPAANLGLRVVTPRAGETLPGPEEGPRIAVCVEGEVEIEVAAGEAQRLLPGEAVFVPHIDGALAVSGNGTAVVARA
ncbi:mannose-6-phosphate isomerase, class I [Cellulosimicrobium cellulans]|uniref:mannose-6-phosphate isomerase, class I n=1 Tax=Cellulosimicrobium cellulans TaxID=1710 RepID=UPI002149E21C|nr:mannose-6-phosphate isomerase, class I [Cellulosimicrobium cellulans]